MLGSNVLDVARLRRRLVVAGAAVSLVAVSLTAGPVGANANPEFASTYIDQEVYAELERNGTTEFFVYLTANADLSATRTMETKLEKASYVYQQLTSVAEASQADLKADLDARGIEYTSYWIANALLVTGDRALVDELAARPDVARIEPNREFELVEPVERVPAPDAAVNATEWGIQNINADDVWDLGYTGVGIVVANIDTGVQYNHPALVNQYRGNTGSGFDHNYNWHDPTGICGASPCDNNGHGTHTMGTMVGDDGGSNQIGVAPGAKWIAAKGCGTSSCSSSHLLSAGQWMVAPTDLNGQNADPSKAPDIVNNSWGGGRGDTWYQATINAWRNAGIFPVFSAGNSGPGCNTANSPADNLPAYSVGAYNSSNAISSFSSRGYSGVDGTTIKPDIAAPGQSVRSAVPTNSYASYSGTSMAAPHVSGVVALIWSAAPDYRGNIAGTIDVLDTTARDMNNTSCGGTPENNNVWGEGRIDALAAVLAATGGTPPPPPPPPPPPGLKADFTHSCTSLLFFLYCSFDASSSTGNITSYSWNFGDGGTGSGVTVSYLYLIGNYNVTLTVSGPDGSDSVTKSVP